TEPGPRWLVRPADRQQVVEDRRQQIDRYDHVDVARRTLLAALLQLQRADAEQIAIRADQRSAAPVGMRRRGEDRFVDDVFPVAGKLLLGDDTRRHGFLPA